MEGVMTELSCSCGLDPDDSERWYAVEGWTSLMAQGAKRRRRCSSCKELIDINAECLMFSNRRMPNETEEDIFGEDAEIDMAPSWHCEKCGEIFEGLDDAGFCFYINKDNMVDAMKAYHKLTGFKPLEKFGREE
jgi:hypothetical protein